MRVSPVNVGDPGLVGVDGGQARDVAGAPGLEGVGAAEGDGVDGVGAARAGVVERARGLVGLHFLWFV